MGDGGEQVNVGHDLGIWIIWCTGSKIIVLLSLEKEEECLTFWITVKPSPDHFQLLMGGRFRIKVFRLNYFHKKYLFEFGSH